MSTFHGEEQRKFKIIIVDDNPANLRLLSDLLIYEGYEVRPANSGKLALASALAAPPDLVLLDVLLPDMNGYEICQELKSHEAFADIPILFMSGLDESVEKAKAFACGGAEYIAKPFQHKEVLMRVRNHLEVRSLKQLLLEKQQAEIQANEQIAALQQDNESLRKQVAADKALIAALETENRQLGKIIRMERQ